ncbi:MAG: HypC/HybG/HupF family hydrogenase formation chaperone [Candidatus Aenigmatarchaeota archaeon]
MCFAIPGKVISIDGEIAQVDFIGQKKEINMKFVKAKPGDYVITAGNVAADVIPAVKAKALVDAFIKANKEMGDV